MTEQLIYQYPLNTTSLIFHRIFPDFFLHENNWLSEKMTEELMFYLIQEVN